MDKTEQIENINSDIPRKIFVQFIEELESSDIPDTVKEELRKTILDNDDLSEASIRKALLTPHIL